MYKAYYLRLSLSVFTAVLRLTFPVREGVMLKPFQLEHGKHLSQQPFHLRESVYRMLLHRYRNMHACSSYEKLHVFTHRYCTTYNVYTCTCTLILHKRGTRTLLHYCCFYRLLMADIVSVYSVIRSPSYNDMQYFHSLHYY